MRWCHRTLLRRSSLGERRGGSKELSPRSSHIPAKVLVLLSCYCLLIYIYNQLMQIGKILFVILVFFGSAAFALAQTVESGAGIIYPLSSGDTTVVYPDDQWIEDGEIPRPGDTTVNDEIPPPGDTNNTGEAPPPGDTNNYDDGEIPPPGDTDNDGDNPTPVYSDDYLWINEGEIPAPGDTNSVGDDPPEGGGIIGWVRSWFVSDNDDEIPPPGDTNNTGEIPPPGDTNNVGDNPTPVGVMGWVSGFLSNIFGKWFR